MWARELLVVVPCTVGLDVEIKAASYGGMKTGYGFMRLSG